MIRWGSLVIAASTLGYALVDGIGPAVVGARILQGLGQAMTYTAFWAYIADRLPAGRRAQGIALFGISGLAPIGIGPVLGDQILASSFGYRGVFLVATACALIAFGLSILLEESVANAPATDFFELLRRPSLRPIWLVTLFLALGFTAAFVFVTTYVAATGVGTVGAFFAAYSLAAITWRLGFAWIPDRIGPARMVIPGLALYAVGLATVGLSASSTGLIAGGLLTGLGHGISFPVVVALATSRASAEERGTTTAIFTALFDISLFGASPVIGWMIEQFGYGSSFTGVGLAVLVGIVIFHVTERRWVRLEALATGEPATAPVPHV
jgi:MFS family permease